MKIAVFACQKIGIECLKFLRNRRDVRIPLVVTHERAVDAILGYASVADYCRKAGIDFVRSSCAGPELTSRIRAMAPDMILSIYYRGILPAELVSLPPRGSVNIHPSLLPDYRGPVPTAWALENGEKYFGVTIHYMDAGIDTGDILVQEKYPILKDETGYELFERAMRLGAGLFRKHFAGIASGRLPARKQKGIGTYYGKKNGRAVLDWRKKGEEIRSLVRVYAKPYNRVEARLLNRQVWINRVSVLKDRRYPAQGPGRILKVFGNGRLVVSCADGCVVLDDYEIAPKLESREKALFLKPGNKFEV